MKYVVRVYEVSFVDIEVEVDSEESAKEEANNILCAGDDCERTYSHTMDTDDWTVKAV